MEDLSHGDTVDFARVARWAKILTSFQVEVPWELLDGMVQAVSTLAGESSEEAILMFDILGDLVAAVGGNLNPCEEAHAAELASTLAKTLLPYHLKLNASSSRVLPLFSFRIVLTSSIQSLRKILRLLIHVFNVEPAEIDRTSFHGDPVPMIPISARLRMLLLDRDILSRVAQLLPAELQTTELCLDFMWLMLTHAKAVADVQRLVHSHSAQLYTMYVYAMPTAQS